MQRSASKRLFRPFSELLCHYPVVKIENRLLCQAILTLKTLRSSFACYAKPFSTLMASRVLGNCFSLVPASWLIRSNGSQRPGDALSSGGGFNISLLASLRNHQKAGDFLHFSHTVTSVTCIFIYFYPFLYLSFRFHQIICNSVCIIIIWN